MSKIQASVISFVAVFLLSGAAMHGFGANSRIYALIPLALASGAAVYIYRKSKDP